MDRARGVWKIVTRYVQPVKRLDTERTITTGIRVILGFMMRMARGMTIRHGEGSKMTESVGFPSTCLICTREVETVELIARSCGPDPWQHLRSELDGPLLMERVNILHPCEHEVTP